MNGFEAYTIAARVMKGEPVEYETARKAFNYLMEDEEDMMIAQKIGEKFPQIWEDIKAEYVGGPTERAEPIMGDFR